MDYYAGIDVCLEPSSVCILDASGQIVREAKVASEPEALATFLASLDLPLTRVGPMVLDGPMTGPWFAAYVEQNLVPTLRPGDVVILDNLPPHKSAAVRDLVEATGATLRRLPPYSPDFNPTENAFAKLKALLRKVAVRSKEALWRTIGELLDEFSPEECANDFRAAGYESEQAEMALVTDKHRMHLIQMLESGLTVCRVLHCR